MAPPANGIYIVQGEMNFVVMAMKRGNKWSSHAYLEPEDALVRNFSNLKEILNHVSDLSDLEPNQFLSPFLEVIRSGDTTGPVTGLALASVNRFLTYGLIDASCETAAAAVENITDAVTHARFVGTDPGSDEVVLMKILQVLKTLLLTQAGVLLSNESVCEIMQSCFRICFEMRLSELLRKSAENSLVDMAQLLFARLPQFSEDDGVGTSFRKLKMRTGIIDASRGKHKKKSPRAKHRKTAPPTNIQSKKEESPLNDTLSAVPSPDSGVVTPQDVSTPATTPCEVVSKEFCKEESPNSQSGTPVEVVAEPSCSIIKNSVVDMQDNLQIITEVSEMSSLAPGNSDSCDGQESLNPVSEKDYINPHGVRFTQQNGRDGPLIPYGLPCVRELFRFLVSLINPLDKQNSDVMIHIGLTLLIVALETNADDIGKFTSLLNLVKDEMCRNLLFLINSEKFSLFAITLRVCFLLFESLRSHLKFQLEMFLNRLMSIIMSESPKVTYEQRETVLESLVQLWRIPGLVTELYLNYDCDLYCSHLFEELTKLLSKNAFPMSGLYSTHILSLDALITVIDGIESHCHAKVLRDREALESSKDQKAISIKGSDTEAYKSSSTTTEAITLRIQPASGYIHGQDILANDKTLQLENDNMAKAKRKRQLNISENAPSHAELINIKHRKKILLAGTEQFNSKPSKGIQFLQENGILNAEFCPVQVATFLKENPHLDKKMIGEFISNRKNLKVLEAFVKSFNFEDTRLDEALRMYLETFRLPGEAPVISLLLEHFADHWHKSNGSPFANSDAAFTLAYAVIILNVDQHNHNVKKQSNPMTLEDFKKNLTRVNDGKDFDSDMLEDIYCAIRSEEIVMPAEHTGLVKENYLWKMLLRRGLTKDGVFVTAPPGFFDHDLFALTWGPTVAALSFVFDKSGDDAVIQKVVSGFRKCAMIAAHYGMSDVFDHIIITLCKFTTLLNSSEGPDNFPVTFGSYSKAQIAAKAVFNLTHRHGDILREGWKNILDCLLQLYNSKLLPKTLVEVEDFIDPSGKVSLLREEIPAQRPEGGLLSSFYSYITLTADTQLSKGLTAEEQECTQQAQACIYECHPEQLISESKFLRADSLQELVKALIFASPGPDSHASSHSASYNEDATVFFLELLVEIILHNRDRVNVVWQGVRAHIYGLMMGASATEHVFLLERSVVSILRLAVRLLWREDMTAQVMQSLRMLLLLKPSSLLSVARQIAFALHELLKTSAANIHAAEDWSTLFTLLEYVGAGAKPPKILDGGIVESTDSASENGVQSDSELCSETVGSESPFPERGYTSDSELYEHQSTKGHAKSNKDIPTNVDSAGSWILIGKEGEIENVQVQRVPVNHYDIVLKKDFMQHDPAAFFKCCESLAFLVRDVVHVTPENFESCIHCIRTFAEASLNGGKHYQDKKSKNRDTKERKVAHRLTNRQKEGGSRAERVLPSSKGIPPPEDDKVQTLNGEYHQISTQLLDLMHTLHTRAASIFTTWASEAKSESQHVDVPYNNTGDIWTKCWCPLLQGIARLCCDSRRQVRTSAVTYLQRALLVHDLQTLSAVEWEACFHKVLFPLLLKLLENINQADHSGVEETRMRGATLLCKVFLQHLTPLLSLPTFTALWLTILEFMDKYMHADKSDLLCEAIPESLKNMLLVMDTAGIFSSSSAQSQLWTVTCDRLESFLPNLKDEVFKSHQRGDIKISEDTDQSPTISLSKPTTLETSNQSPSSVVISIEEPSNTSNPLLSNTAAAVESSLSSSSLILHPLPREMCPAAVGVASQPPVPALHLQPLPSSATSIPLIVNCEIIENTAPLQIISASQSHVSNI